MPDPNPAKFIFSSLDHPKRIEGAAVESYTAVLKGHSRPPSQGGNTRALHLHVLTIGGQAYTFFVLGSKKWVFKGDTVFVNLPRPGIAKVGASGYRAAVGS